MTRLIDADALGAEMYHKSFEVDNGRNVWNVWNNGLWIRYKIYEEAIREAPTVDAVEVIRCKDCKWFGKAGCAVNIVDESDEPKENDYCSWAERKEDDKVD